MALVEKSAVASVHNLHNVSDRQEPVPVARSDAPDQDAGVAEAAGREAQHAAALPRRQADRGRLRGVIRGGQGQPPLRVLALQRAGEKTRGQWPCRPAATRAMKDEHIVLKSF